MKLRSFHPDAAWTLACLLLPGIILSSCKKSDEPVRIAQWTTHETAFVSENTYQNGYTDVEVWARFTNELGDTLLRPAFWDGDNTWKIRFAPPDTGSIWSWTTFASVQDKGLSGKTGVLRSVAYTGETGSFSTVCCACHRENETLCMPMENHSWSSAILPGPFPSGLRLSRCRCMPETGKGRVSIQPC